MNEQRDETQVAESALDRSGMGPLPGMALAMVIGVLLIGGVLIDEWWVVPIIFVALVAITVVVVAVLIALMEDEGEGRLRRYVPGL